MIPSLAKFKAATVQTSPVFLDTQKTVDKACSIIQEVGKAGAKIVAFPEVFISAYPYWSWIDNPVDAGKWFNQICHSAIYVDGPEVKKLCQTAKAYDINVVIGCNEKVRYSHGTIFNTNLIINNKGELIGAHRKLVPTWAEKLTWTGGDGSTLKVYDTNVGGLGTLACGENTNSLARYTLLSQGETLHVANYIALPVSPSDYNMAEAIKIRAAAHSFEGKIFTLVSCSTITEDIIQLFEKQNPKVRELFERKNASFTGIIGPGGDTYGEPLIDDEGIVYAEIDTEKMFQPKQMHDILGHYNRFDIFKLTVNTSKNEPISYSKETDKNSDSKLIITA